MEIKLNFVYNKPVWKAWLGYRAALFLELGEKNTPEFPTDYERGGYTIRLDKCDWTIYRGDKIVADSGDQDFKKMAKDVRILEGLSIQEIEYLSKQKEWKLQFNDGTQLNIEFFSSDSDFGITSEEKTYALNSTGEVKENTQQGG
jgi:hypothetical protein